MLKRNTVPSFNIDLLYLVLSAWFTLNKSTEDEHMFFPTIKVFYEKNLVTVLVKNSIQVPTTSVCPVFTRPLHDAGLTSAYPSVTLSSQL